MLWLFRFILGIDRDSKNSYTFKPFVLRFEFGVSFTYANVLWLYKKNNQNLMDTRQTVATFKGCENGLMVYFIEKADRMSLKQFIILILFYKRILFMCLHNKYLATNPTKYTFFPLANYYLK